MKKNVVVLFLLVLSFALVSCNDAMNTISESLEKISTESDEPDISVSQDTDAAEFETDVIVETESAEKTEAIVETSLLMEKESVEEGEPIDFGVGGIKVHCRHEAILPFHFHSFSSTLINYVGEEAFNEYMKENFTFPEDCLEDCGMANLYLFVRDFNIPREYYEQLNNYTPQYYDCDYDTDLLYGDDYCAFEDYYINYNNGVEFCCRQAEYKLKSKLLGIGCQYNLPNETKWMEEEGLKDDEMLVHNTNFCNYAIPQVIYSFDIPRSEVEEILSGCGYHFDYDLDRIYNERESLEAEIAAAKALPTQLEQFAAIRAIDVSLRNGTVKEKK